MSGSRITSDPVYVPQTLPIPETVKRMEQRKKVTIRVKGQSPEQLSAQINQPAMESREKPLRPGEDKDGSFNVFNLDVVDYYDGNPRTSVNPKYEEIKASIRRSGLQGNLTVTKRPGATKYMLYAGGNTRLKILRELYAETGDRKFYEISCVFHTWKGEADVLASHLIENEARGDTRFIEKARGLIQLMRTVEGESGKRISSREISDKAAEMGMVVSQTTVLLYLYAVDNLDGLGIWLTFDNVSTIKRRHAQYEPIAKGLGRQGEFRSVFQERWKTYQLGLAWAWSAREKALREAGDTTTVVALASETLAEFLDGQDALIAEMFGLEQGASRRIFAALDAGGKEALSGQALQALLRGEAPPVTDAGAMTDTTSTVPVTEAGVTQPLSPSRSPAPHTAKEAGKGGAREQSATVPVRAAKTSEEGSSDTSSGPIGAPQTTVLPASELPPSEAGAPGETLTEDRFKQIGGAFFLQLDSFSRLTRTNSWLLSDSSLDLPYLFWIEMPQELAADPEMRLDEVADAEFGVLDPGMARVRSAAYRLLALLSGQLGGVIELKGRWTNEATFALRLPEESAWRVAALADRMTEEAFLFTWERQFEGITAAQTAQLSAAPHDLLCILQEPILAEGWLALTQAYSQWGQALAMWRAQCAVPEDA